MLIVFKGEVTVRLISINGSVTISGKIAVKEFKSYPSGDAFKISIECGERCYTAVSSRVWLCLK